MKTNSPATLLRFYLSNTDKFRHAPLSDVIVFAGKRFGLSGATVIKGSMGYGSSHVIYSSRLWEITEKLPVIVEFIDETEKIQGFLSSITPWLDKINSGLLVTSQPLEVVMIKKGSKKNFGLK
ncbi:MAG: DUF190 domain-containing protein [Lentimicrobium sp.]|jgi:hypothetical protein|nr:DUF190 domain-containing protein [Lentimicrobium sp.]